MNALLMIAAHMLGDYVLQTNDMAARKLVDWKVRTLHVVCYTLPFHAIPLVNGMGFMEWMAFIGIVAVPHWIVDCRRWASPDPWGPKPIMVDQSLHAACLAAAAVVFGL